jgi:hypothetical protein
LTAFARNIVGDIASILKATSSSMEATLGSADHVNITGTIGNMVFILC